VTNKKKRSPQGRLLAAAVALSLAAIVAAGALHGASLLTVQPRAAADGGSKTAVMASNTRTGSTAIIVSTPNSNDCRGYQLNVVTGERGDQGRVDCDTGADKPGRLETIAKSFRNR
jgi:hypothetical protein